jgi:hypothetical protein
MRRPPRPPAKRSAHPGARTRRGGHDRNPVPRPRFRREPASRRRHPGRASHRPTSSTAAVVLVLLVSGHWRRPTVEPGAARRAGGANRSAVGATVATVRCRDRVGSAVAGPRAGTRADARRSRRRSRRSAARRPARCRRWSRRSGRRRREDGTSRCCKATSAPAIQAPPRTPPAPSTRPMRGLRFATTNGRGTCTATSERHKRLDSDPTINGNRLLPAERLLTPLPSCRGPPEPRVFQPSRATREPRLRSRSAPPAAARARGHAARSRPRRVLRVAHGRGQGTKRSRSPCTSRTGTWIVRMIRRYGQPLT